MLDALPKLLIELRDDPDVDQLVDGRVRGYEPAPGDSAWTTDPASGNRKFAHAFVVLVRLDAPRFARAPVQQARIAARCYGRTKEEAYAVYAACSDAIANRGPRLHANGLGIYISHDDTGATQDRDPVTQQPLEEFVISLAATTQAVT